MTFARIFVAPAPNGKVVLPAFMERGKDFNFTGVKIVQNIDEADLVVIPHAIRTLTKGNYREYVENTASWARERGKQTVVFLSGDLAYREHVAGAIVFKHSLFRHGKRAGELVSVPFVDDPYQDKKFVPRRKGERPIVAFCGYAELTSPLDWTKYYLRNLFFDAAAALRRVPHLRAHKRGIYFRKKSMEILERDSRIKTLFIVRDSFFGPMSPENNPEYRREYLENMRTADFALAPRGDGNYSRRFFRALSLGVVPILIDTDMVLPLENAIDYSKFTLRIPHDEIKTLPERITALYTSLSDEQFAEMQYAARDAYVQYLNQSAFYNTAFPLLKEHGPAGL